MDTPPDQPSKFGLSKILKFNLELPWYVSLVISLAVFLFPAISAIKSLSASYPLGEFGTITLVLYDLPALIIFFILGCFTAVAFAKKGDKNLTLALFLGLSVLITLLISNIKVFEQMLSTFKFLD